MYLDIDWRFSAQGVFFEDWRVLRYRAFLFPKSVCTKTCKNMQLEISDTLVIELYSVFWNYSASLTLYMYLHLILVCSTKNLITYMRTQPPASLVLLLELPQVTPLLMFLEVKLEIAIQTQPRVMWTRCPTRARRCLARTLATRIRAKGTRTTCKITVKILSMHQFCLVLYQLRLESRYVFIVCLYDHTKVCG